jgi:hypothetical protein
MYDTRVEMYDDMMYSRVYLVEMYDDMMYSRRDYMRLMCILVEIYVGLCIFLWGRLTLLRSCGRMSA